MENKIADFNTLSSPNFLGSSILKLKIEPFVFLAIFLTVNRQSFLHLLLKGLISWKRVNNEDKCTIVHHIGCPLSPHNMAMDKWQGL